MGGELVVKRATDGELGPQHEYENAAARPASARRGARDPRPRRLEAVARCIGLEPGHLCRGCLTGNYPTATGERLYQLSLRNRNGTTKERTYELAAGAAVG